MPSARPSESLPGIFHRWDPTPGTTPIPLVVDVSRSGREYPHDFRSPAPFTDVHDNVSMYVEELWDAAPRSGATMLYCCFPNIWVDTNRHVLDIDPELVGNQMRVVVSELAGRGNVRMRAKELGLELNGNERVVLQRIKELESRGFQFEAAEGSFEMLVRRAAPDYEPPFELLDFTVIVEERGTAPVRSQAIVKLRVGGEVMHTAAEGDGPVNALDQAIRKALLPHYPELAEVHLVDYKVRIVDEHLGTAARPRVLIESARGEERWSTVGCSENIIEASWQALWDSLELPLLRARQAARAQATA